MDVTRVKKHIRLHGHTPSLVGRSETRESSPVSILGLRVRGAEFLPGERHQLPHVHDTILRIHQ